MDSHLEFLSDSEARTDEFGRICALAVSESLTIALTGQLGAGKTRFVQAFCEGLGVDRSQVNSPTFVLMQLYEGDQWSISHFDTYRLGDTDEFLDLGADEFLHDAARICLVEWADRVAESLPHDRVNAEIHQIGISRRRFEFTSTGARSHRFLTRVRELLTGTIPPGAKHSGCESC